MGLESIFLNPNLSPLSSLPHSWTPVTYFINYMHKIGYRVALTLSVLKFIIFLRNWNISKKNMNQHFLSFYYMLNKGVNSLYTLIKNWNHLNTHTQPTVYNSTILPFWDTLPQTNNLIVHYKNFQNNLSTFQEEASMDSLCFRILNLLILPILNNISVAFTQTWLSSCLESNSSSQYMCDIFFLAMK